MNKFTEWQATHDAAVAEINTFLKPQEHYQTQMNELVEWMMTTESNPFAYLPLEWASSLGSAESFAALLNHIHHALYDDGDITFVTVNDEPRIVFANPYDDNFNEQVITPNDRAIANRRALLNSDNPIKVNVLTITPSEFGPLQEAYEIKQMKRAFAFEAFRYGIEFAVQTASRSKHFNSNWIDECAEQIAKYKAAFSQC